MIHSDDFSSMDGHDTLIRRIASLHVVYMFSKSQIMWFGQLVSQKPGIMLALKNKRSPDTSEMVLLYDNLDNIILCTLYLHYYFEYSLL